MLDKHGRQLKNRNPESLEVLIVTLYPHQYLIIFIFPCHPWAVALVLATYLYTVSAILKIEIQV